MPRLIAGRVFGEADGAVLVFDPDRRRSGVWTSTQDPIELHEGRRGRFDVRRGRARLATGFVRIEDAADWAADQVL